VALDASGERELYPHMPIDGKKVLVTGAGGFIGSHLVETLVDHGADVTAMLHYNGRSSIGDLRYATAERLSKTNISFGNIEDGDYVRQVVKGHDVVFHLAALIAIPYSYIAPRSYIKTNIEGTLNVMEAARREGTSRVVHTSTSEVYGTALRVPIDEDHPLQGQSPYSASKIGADKIAESYYRSFELPVVTLRPFNTFGPRQSARAFIPTIISQLLYADEVNLGSLTPQRDMTYVSDTVSGFVAAASAPNIDGETLNLGTGHAESIGEFLSRIQRLMGTSKDVRQDPARMRPEKSEVNRLVSDNSKARRLLAWRPEVSIDVGLQRVIEFMREDRATYNPAKYTI
jgi:NAD dependent epimerase/dehydratase